MNKIIQINKKVLGYSIIPEPCDGITFLVKARKVLELQLDTPPSVIVELRNLKFDSPIVTVALSNMVDAKLALLVKRKRLSEPKTLVKEFKRSLDSDLWKLLVTAHRSGGIHQGKKMINLLVKLENHYGLSEEEAILKLEPLLKTNKLCQGSIILRACWYIYYRAKKKKANLDDYYWHCWNEYIEPNTKTPGAIINVR